MSSNNVNNNGQTPMDWVYTNTSSQGSSTTGSSQGGSSASSFPPYEARILQFHNHPQITSNTTASQSSTAAKTYATYEKLHGPDQ